MQWMRIHTPYMLTLPSKFDLCRCLIYLLYVSRTCCESICIYIMQIRTTWSENWSKCKSLRLTTNVWWGVRFRLKYARTDCLSFLLSNDNVIHRWTLQIEGFFSKFCARSGWLSSAWSSYRHHGLCDDICQWFSAKWYQNDFEWALASALMIVSIANVHFRTGPVENVSGNLTDAVMGTKVATQGRL